jgi:anti-sigma B factor antagonist
MEIDSRATGGALVFTVVGDIDGKTAPELHAAVAPKVPPDGSVLLDMSGVGYMSSAGLRALLLLHREAQGKRARLVLVGLAEELRETMALTGFDQHFTLCGTLDSGLASLK